jgi:hypothetical protein
MIQRKLGIEVRTYGVDKYKFINPEVQEKKLKFIKKIYMGSIGQYKRVSVGSMIKAFFNFHRVMLKRQKNKNKNDTAYASKKIRHGSTTIWRR